VDACSGIGEGGILDMGLELSFLFSLLRLIWKPENGDGNGIELRAVVDPISIFPETQAYYSWLSRH